MKSFTKHIIPLIYFAINLIAQDNFQFEFDYAQFQADSSSNILEIYYELNPAKLIDQAKSNHTDITNKIIFNISNSVTSDIIWSDTVSNNFKITDLVNNEKYSNIIGINKAVLTDGSYILSIKIYDGSKYIPVANESILIKLFSSNLPVISDLQLAESIKQDSILVEDLFSKNTLRVIPNSSTSYTSDSPLLVYYTELYNLSGKELQLSTYILSPKSEVVFSETEQIKTTNKSIVHIDQINLLRYASGIYTLQLILTDSTTNYAYASQKKFYFYNKLYTPKVELQSSGKAEIATSIFVLLSAEECDDIFEKSKYIATSDEKNQYEKLNSEDSKREFLFTFWKKRVGESTNDPGIVYSNYMNQVEEANKKFKALGTEGFKTERGRVFLTYGKPDKVDNYPNENNLKPHEIWYYNSIEGGVTFIFGDLNGFGDYVLLHSTKRGEAYDESWQRRLYVN